MHIPVLLKEAVDGLSLTEGAVVFDGTFGEGGHSAEICKLIGKHGRLIATDEDPHALEISKSRDELKLCKFELVSGNFRNLERFLNERDVEYLDAALFDLGLSSHQLDESGRGFTFQKDEPLNMTFGSVHGGLVAKEILNEWGEENLADIIYGFSGEKYSRRIAANIVKVRREKPILTTFDLVKIIEGSVPAEYRRRKIHCATKTFQAIRMAVNDETTALRDTLPKVWGRLRQGGRIAVISFHDIEDRIVKNFLRDKSKEGGAKIVTKKPIVPTRDEILLNIRSRSAKLRIGEKI